jgi:hypothetical protein
VWTHTSEIEEKSLGLWRPSGRIPGKGSQFRDVVYHYQDHSETLYHTPYTRSTNPCVLNPKASVSTECTADPLPPGGGTKSRTLILSPSIQRPNRKLNCKTKIVNAQPVSRRQASSRCWWRLGLACESTQIQAFPHEIGRGRYRATKKNSEVKSCS